MKRFLAILLALVVVAAGAERPKAAAGFKWKSYKKLYCEIQVPKGWHEHQTTAGITQVVRISPTPLKNGDPLVTGFTMNTVKAKSQEDWSAAMTLVGEMMSSAREATPNPIQSTVKDEKNMLLMVIEGERLIPTAPNPEKPYHVRTIVRAFPEFATIYMYSFGAPADEWEEAWKSGSVMLNPILFQLRK